jgi:hypothetical protein
LITRVVGAAFVRKMKLRKVEIACNLYLLAEACDLVTDEAWKLLLNSAAGTRNRKGCFIIVKLKHITGIIPDFQGFP